MAYLGTKGAPRRDCGGKTLDDRYWDCGLAMYMDETKSSTDTRAAVQRAVEAVSNHPENLRQEVEEYTARIVDGWCIPPVKPFPDADKPGFVQHTASPAASVSNETRAGSGGFASSVLCERSGAQVRSGVEGDRAAAGVDCAWGEATSLTECEAVVDAAKPDIACPGAGVGNENCQGHPSLQSQTDSLGKVSACVAESASVQILGSERVPCSDPASRMRVFHARVLAAPARMR